MLFRFVHIWFCDCLQCRCQIIIMVWFQFNFHFVPKSKPRIKHHTNKHIKVKWIKNVERLATEPNKTSQLLQLLSSQWAACAHRRLSHNSQDPTSAQLPIASVHRNSHLLISHLLNCSLLPWFTILICSILICSTANCITILICSFLICSTAHCFSHRTSSCCAVLLLHLLRKNDPLPPPLHWYHYRDHLLVHPAGANIMVDLVQAVFEEISLERNPALWQSERDSRFL